MKLHTLFKTREPENHTLLGGIKYPVADTDVFPVVASPHWKILSGVENKRRSEIRLCPQATALRRETHTTAEPLYNEFLGITNDYVYPSNSKVYAKELGISKPRYIANTFSFCQPLCPFFISKIHCRRIIAPSIPSVLIPLPGHLPGFFHLVDPGGGEFVRKPFPGGGAFVNSSRRG